MFLFPIGDVNVKNGHKPIFSRLFIGINILIFLYQYLIYEPGPAVFNHTYGLIPKEFSRGEDIFTAWTSMFMHGGIKHILGNMLFLYVFADNIEARIGSIKFLLFYFFGGLAAALFQTFANIDSVIPMVGASGCISACLGAYFVMFPKGKIKLLLIFFIVKVPALLFLGLWGAQQFIAAYRSLTITQDTGGVAYWAHIGGFIFGVMCGFFFRKLRKE